mmetsp:Transcript_73055/g.176288  ORF Transcript_73055/g.176288 Transcript_73055/m.176288 type:complete len:255 (+) Transcript_73055:67-831(+)
MCSLLNFALPGYRAVRHEGPTVQDHVERFDAVLGLASLLLFPRLVGNAVSAALGEAVQPVALGRAPVVLLLVDDAPRPQRRPRLARGHERGEDVEFGTFDVDLEVLHRVDTLALEYRTEGKRGRALDAQNVGEVEPLQILRKESRRLAHGAHLAHGVVQVVPRNVLGWHAHKVDGLSAMVDAYNGRVDLAHVGTHRQPVQVVRHGLDRQAAAAVARLLNESVAVVGTHLDEVECALLAQARGLPSRLDACEKRH